MTDDGSLAFLNLPQQENKQWLKWCDSSHLAEKIHKTIKQTKNIIENESTLCKQAKRH